MLLCRTFKGRGGDRSRARVQGQPRLKLAGAVESGCSVHLCRGGTREGRERGAPSGAIPLWQQAMPCSIHTHPSHTPPAPAQARCPGTHRLPLVSAPAAAARPRGRPPASGRTSRGWRRPRPQAAKTARPARGEGVGCAARWEVTRCRQQLPGEGGRAGSLHMPGCDTCLPHSSADPAPLFSHARLGVEGRHWHGRARWRHPRLEREPFHGCLPPRPAVPAAHGNPGRLGPPRAVPARAAPACELLIKREPGVLQQRKQEVCSSVGHNVQRQLG